MSKGIDFDWTQARAFLATAEAGSFSGGARALGLTQPTLSRQVAALEADLGVTLFERIGNALHLTQTGLDLLDHVRAMAEGADKVALTASGRAQEVEGTVTITVTDLVATTLLPPVLARLKELSPGIIIEITATNNVQDLRRREADISIRHVRPTEPDLIGRHLWEAGASLYGATRYLDQLGRPLTDEAIAEADFIGFGEDSLDEYIAGLAEYGVTVRRDQFRLSSGTGMVCWALAQAGLGLLVMMDEVAAVTPGIEAVFPDRPPLTFPVWLVAHREVHTSRRIRIVYDCLAEVLLENRRLRMRSA